MATSITATNKAPLILIVTWLLLVLAAFAYIVRSVVKISRQAFRLELDDYLLTGALVFCTAQSIATVVRATDGFGKPIDTQSQASIDASLKAELAANILYVISVALSKLSLLALVTKLTPNRQHKRLLHATSGFVALWTLVSIFIVSFSCKAPNTWDYIRGSCINRSAWWIAFDAYNIVTESLLIVIPIYIISLVQWTLSRKIMFTIPFILRGCTIAACIADMVFWQRVYSTASDPFFAEWQVSVTTQVIQCSCLACTCVLYLRNFFASVETGFGLDGELGSSIPLELRNAYPSNLSSEVLTQSATVPGHIRVTTRYEVKKELLYSSGTTTRNTTQQS